MERFTFTPAQTAPLQGRSSFASGLGGASSALGGMFSNSFGGGLTARTFQNAPTSFAGSGRSAFQPLGQGYNVVNAYNAGYKPPAPPATPGATGAPGTVGVPTSGDWALVNRWDQAVLAAASRYGVDPNLIKAHMMIESHGEPGAVQPNQANGYTYGLMQVNTGIWGDALAQQGIDWRTPEGNIMAGAYVLKTYYDQHKNWDAASSSYFTGQPGWMGADTHNGTTGGQYRDLLQQHLSTLRASGGTVSSNGSANGWDGSTISSYGTSSYAPPAGSGLWTITGGTPFGISQGFGLTDFAMNSSYGQSAYGYSSAYGAQGHIGLDISTPVGTPMYAPMGGTIVTAGGTGYYNDYFGQGLGEIKLRLDNGDEIIFGHSSTAAVPVGARVQAGQMIGTSGGENGPHIHLEVRVKGGNTPSGYQAVDPRDYFSGSFVSPTGGMPGAASGSPMTYSGSQDLNAAFLARGRNRGSGGYGNYASYGSGGGNYGSYGSSGFAGNTYSGGTRRVYRGL